MRGLSAQVIAALESSNIKYAYLVELEFDTSPLYFSSLRRNITYNAKEYIGAGNLGRISASMETAALEPSSLTIGITGVNPAVLPVVFSQEYINRPVKVTILFLDDNNDPIGDCPYYLGTMSNIGLSYGIKSGIEISVSDQLAVWNRPKVSRYTDEDQKANFPTDRGFEAVERLQDFTIIWPAKEFFD